MTPLFLVLALIIQCSFIRAEDVDIPENKDELIESFKKPEVDDEVVKDFQSAKKDWIDMLMMPSPMFPSSSVALMQQATNGNKTAEEQLKAIKDVAQDILRSIQSEFANLMSDAVNNAKETEDNKQRKRRSIETPMDSTQMVMRLLQHIKSNNEYQNIAIEKMMSAQEIADKFGIEFNPDPEIISDLAVAANDHAHELATLLQDACELKNVTQETVEFVPYNDEQNLANDTYYAYALHAQETSMDDSVPYFEYEPELVSKPQATVDHVNVESQIPEPPHHHHHHHHHAPSVTQRPNFFEPFPFTPAPYYNGFEYSEPVSTTYVLAVEEPEPEPEIVGEEIEETITSKLFVERGDEPGSSTVNHVTTYTVAEKSHYRAPQIERLPEQFQYCFLLI